MKPKLLIPLLAALLSAGSCCPKEQHFISDRDELATMIADFESRKADLPYGGLETISSLENLTPAEQEALQFLYAYMPLADIADHDTQFYLDQIRCSFRARQEMSWGADIPEREFRHFVLPIRVNNEDLDNSRLVFYEELKERVAGLTLYDAVLEINHWCHEHVIYTPSDARTSSPSASIRTGHGRCGEESTLTVAALRAMCIPARQVYTPRWAHTDDNHAWVEAWVNGKWYFLGACEPEPVLDLAWFNAPVSRGMLMHTKAFGRYNGPEEKMRSTRVFTEINVTENYAEVARSDIRVLDKEGRPAAGAKVEFKVYNYGEYFTVSTKETDEEGRTFLSAGLGDMLVWASREGKFGFSEVAFGKDREVTIVLDKKAGDLFSTTLDITPPAEHPFLPEVTPEQRAENDRRLAEEDALRNAYIATFPNAETISAFARQHGLDGKLCQTYLTASRGNYRAIMDFLAGLDTPESQEAGLDLLGRISQKDLRDVPAAVLNDHLRHHLDCREELTEEYVRNPRIRTELLTAYNQALLSQAEKELGEEKLEQFKKEPMELAAWVQENIKVDTLCNMGGAPISPAGVWKCRTADVNSRNIFFTAFCRTLGIPVRIDPVTGKIQIWTRSEGQWARADVDFRKVEATAAPTGKLQLDFQPTALMDDPKYYAHFTISRITPEGSLRLQNYEEGEVDMGGGTTWNKVFRKGTVMDAGDYVLVTGIRLANGGVLSHLSSFSIREGKTTRIPLVIREAGTEIQVIGSFNSESKFLDQKSGELKSILQACGRGYFTVGILGMGQEPTNHALRDLAARKDDLGQWGRTLVLLFPDQQGLDAFLHSDFPAQMPSGTVYGVDVENIRQQIATEMKFHDRNGLPIFIIGDTFNRVVFARQGYTIGLGDQLLQVIRKL